MDELLIYIAELHVRTAELKRLVVGTPGVEGVKLREGIYQLEAAIHVMERNASDAYKASTTELEARSA